MRIAVVGIGTFGRALALNLARMGAEVIAIDNDMKALDEVKHEVALAVNLDVTDVKALRQHGVNNVDALVACMSSQFEDNQILALTAKELGVPRVLVRARTAMQARILEMIGVNEIIMPEELAVKATLTRLVEPSLANQFKMIEGFSAVELRMANQYVGKAIKDVALFSKYRMCIVALYRQGSGRTREVVPVPSNAEILKAGDTILVCGSDDELLKLRAALAP